MNLRFFIDRPIFSSVLSLFIFITGFIAIWQLPISEYPDVSPPSVIVNASYPGANPKVIAQTVAAPLEEQINGVEDMLYMFSQATSDGQMTLTVTFQIGTDPDRAQQLVQNRVNQALPRLPDVVRQFGVSTVKSSPDLTMVVHILSPQSTYDSLYLSNYITLNIKDTLSRLEGVGQVRIFGGSDYAMRIWLDPNKVAARNMSVEEVIAAIREQNLQVAAGTIGSAPAAEGVDLQLNINARGRLESVEEFENIIIKTNETGAVTRLKDVSRIEMGGTSYALRSLLDNKPAVAIAIFQAPDSNAIAVSDSVRAAMEELKTTFPKDVDYSIVYDPTNFVRDSIAAVISTLFEAVILVVIVVIIFLQTWRASIIPLLAVPVSIAGTFAVMHLLGFSINTLSLFGLVLSIGIVVDDAIVVVENVERNISEGLTPKEATYKAMREVSGPIIATSLVLIAVFVPIAFISGLTGQFYRQFALTIAISTVISTINSLTLSPAMAAVLLKDEKAPKDAVMKCMDKYLGGFFNKFNQYFERKSNRYAAIVSSIVKHKRGPLMWYGVFIVATIVLFRVLPSEYIPAQDKQYLIGFAQLPDGASLERTEKVLKKMADIALSNEGVSHAVQFPGLSINGFTVSSNSGIVFLPLKPFAYRESGILGGIHKLFASIPVIGGILPPPKDMSAQGIANQVNMQFGAIKEAFMLVLPPPPVRGLGTTGGFKLQVEDRMSFGNKRLHEVMQSVLMQAYQTPSLARTYTSFQINVPQIFVDIDRTRAKQLGIPISSIFNTMQAYLGSLYINDFNRFGRTYQVIVQADASFRSHAEDIAKLKVRNVKGDMIPLGSLVTVKQSFGPERAMRYNAYRAADLNAEPAPGYSTGQAQADLKKILDQNLPKGMAFEWTDLTYQQILSGNTALYVFPLCVLFVFLVLAAQYESLVLPLVVILIVPMCIFSAIFGVWITGGVNNIFTQIGLVVLVGLACKNAILIVEFARELEFGGKHTPMQAAIEAARIRLRPILMTSFSFIMGVVPLVISTGAGSEMRQDMGITVFFGMLGVTFFGLFLTPIFYVALRELFGGSLVDPNVQLKSTSDQKAPNA